MGRILVYTIAGLSASIGLRNVTDGIGKNASTAGPIIIAVVSVGALGAAFAYAVKNQA